MLLTVPKTLLKFEELTRCTRSALIFFSFRAKRSFNILVNSFIRFSQKRNQVWKIRFRINQNRKAILNFRFRQCKTELRFENLVSGSGFQKNFPVVPYVGVQHHQQQHGRTASGWVAPAPQHLQWCLTIVMIRVRSVMMARTVINIWMTPYTSRVTQSIGCNEYLSSIQSNKHNYGCVS